MSIHQSECHFRNWQRNFRQIYISIPFRMCCEKRGPTRNTTGSSNHFAISSEYRSPRGKALTWISAPCSNLDWNSPTGSPASGFKEFLLSLQVKAKKAACKPKTGSFQRSLTNVVVYLTSVFHFREILASNLGPKTEYPEQRSSPGTLRVFLQTEAEEFSQESVYPWAGLMISVSRQK